jgi:hypothetical protein
VFAFVRAEKNAQNSIFSPFKVANCTMPSLLSRSLSPAPKENQVESCESHPRISSDDDENITKLCNNSSPRNSDSSSPVASLIDDVRKLGIKNLSDPDINERLRAKNSSPLASSSNLSPSTTTTTTTKSDAENLRLCYNNNNINNENSKKWFCSVSMGCLFVLSV